MRGWMDGWMDGWPAARGREENPERVHPSVACVSYMWSELECVSTRPSAIGVERKSRWEGFRFEEAAACALRLFASATGSLRRIHGAMLGWQASRCYYRHDRSSDIRFGRGARSIADAFTGNGNARWLARGRGRARKE